MKYSKLHSKLNKATILSFREWLKKRGNGNQFDALLHAANPEKVFTGFLYGDSAKTEGFDPAQLKSINDMRLVSLQAIHTETNKSLDDVTVKELVQDSFLRGAIIDVLKDWDERLGNLHGQYRGSDDFYNLMHKNINGSKLVQEMDMPKKSEKNLVAAAAALKTGNTQAATKAVSAIVKEHGKELPPKSGVKDLVAAIEKKLKSKNVLKVPNL
ncbi:hypothetical protein [Roseibium algae]|uniref:Uncharacterized protein n=1 Tax=Roseibium algae TaxID=3123038 RepID=A0ABU8TJ15_9HYPH